MIVGTFHVGTASNERDVLLNALDRKGVSSTPGPQQLITFVVVGGN